MKCRLRRRRHGRSRPTNWSTGAGVVRDVQPPTCGVFGIRLSSDARADRMCARICVRLRVASHPLAEPRESAHPPAPSPPRSVPRREL